MSTVKLDKLARDIEGGGEAEAEAEGGGGKVTNRPQLEHVECLPMSTHHSNPTAYSDSGAYNSVAMAETAQSSRVLAWTREKNSNPGPSVVSLINRGTDSSSGSNSISNTNSNSGGGVSPHNNIFGHWDASSLVYRALPMVSERVPVFVLENVLSPDECKAIVEALQGPFTSGGLGYMSPEEVNRLYRGRVSHRFLSFDEELSRIIESRILPYLPKVIFYIFYVCLLLFIMKKNIILC